MICTFERHIIKSFTFYLSRRFLSLEGTLGKLSSSGSVDPELGNIGRQINILEGTTRRIVDDFNDVLRIPDGIKFSIWDLQRTLKDLEKDLVWREAKLLLADVYVDFGHHIERLTTQRDNIAQSVEQTTALEVELERLQKTMEE